MSKIILFFPKYESDEANLLPMSVLSVAAPLIKNGYEVDIIDQRIDKNWKETILAELKKKPLIFGVSALTGEQIFNGLGASKFVKENSNIPIVWGGVHASLLPKQTLENKYIDFVVIGEGEKTLLELVDALKNKKPFNYIKGLGFDDQINLEREFIDMNSIHKIPYNLIDVKKYINNNGIALYTSRGCPHRCSFCYNLKFNKRRWRGKSPERVVVEMKYLINKFNVDKFDIEDDEFFTDIKRAEEICKLIIKERLNIEILTSCRVSYIPLMGDKMLKLMHDAGFRILTFGVETGSKRLIKKISKDISFDQVFETIKRLGDVGITSKFFFMAGFPTETEKNLCETTDLMMKMKKLDSNIRIPAWRIVTPFPGTDLYKESL